MVRDDEGFSEDEIPIKRACHHKDTRYAIMDTKEPMRFKGDLITIENKTRKNLIEEEKNFLACSIERLDPNSRHVKSKFHQTSRNSWTINHW